MHRSLWADLSLGDFPVRSLGLHILGWLDQTPEHSSFHSSVLTAKFHYSYPRTKPSRVSMRHARRSRFRNHVRDHFIFSIGRFAGHQAVIRWFNSGDTLNISRKKPISCLFFRKISYLIYFSSLHDQQRNFILGTFLPENKVSFRELEHNI